MGWRVGGVFASLGIFVGWLNGFGEGVFGLEVVVGKRLG